MNEPTINAAPAPGSGIKLGFHPLMRASGTDPAEAFFWGEQRRHAVFGALVLFTTAMSTAAVFWATTIATDAPLYVAALVAAIWGFGIFHIDQWLVSTHVDRPGLLHRLWLLLPRLAIAVPMGLLVAWFAMLGVADKEIQQQLAKDQGTASEASAERIRTSSEPALRRAELRKEKTELESAYQRAEKAIGPLQTAYDEECAGTGGSRSAGCGPIARAKLKELNAAKANRDAADKTRDTQTTRIDTAISGLDKQIEDLVKAESDPIAKNNGIFVRRAALSTVLADNAEARRLYLLLEIVLVTVDVVPALAKVLSPISMLDVARAVRRRRMREELEAAADAERSSTEVASAFSYAASLRATILREEADARRRLDLVRLQARTGGGRRLPGG